MCNPPFPKPLWFYLTSFLGALISGPSLSAASNVQPRPGAPNVIFILTDDQGYGDLACHGNPYIKSPNLDALHAESLRLTDYHVYPTCSPTRAMLMSGRYPTRSGVWHTIMGRSIMSRDEVTMAEIFRDGGYRTAIFGKWHLGDNYPYRPQDRGFDDVLVHLGGGVGNIQDAWANSYYDDTYFRNGKPEKFTGYCTEVWFNEAIRFIRNNRDRPFFCYLATNAPHQPFIAPERYVAPYLKQGLEPGVAGLYGMITCIDDYVGQLRAALRELGLEKNTLLIFSTDNGTSARNRIYNGSLRGQKSSEYDGGHRVPCFIYWPDGGFLGGRDIPQLTCAADFIPTFMELCGLMRKKGPPLDGQSFAPLLRSEKPAESWSSRILFVDSQRTDFPTRWRKTAVMQDRWRLINGTELYDIRKDPEQKTDIAASNTPVVQRLTRAYNAWWRSLAPALNRENAILIGAPQEDPSVLTTHDVHGQVVWNQDGVLSALPTNGYWTVEAARAGLYEFRLRRWPPEVNAPITASIPVPSGLKTMYYYNRRYSFAENNNESNRIFATHARLKIAGIDRSQLLPDGASEVVFQVPLNAGRTRMQAWFVDGNDEGNANGAYYVVARWVGPLHSDAAAKKKG